MQRLQALLLPFAFILALASPLLPSGPGVALQAIVLPQLSLECLAAIGAAYSTCSSPGLAGAVGCGMALVRVLEACP